MEARGRRVKANKSDPFPDPVELAMSKHEQKAPRQSQLKLKVKGKVSAVQMARTGVLLAPKQQLLYTTANGANRRASAVQSLSWRQISNSNRMRNICKMALGLRQTSHSAGHWRFLPPFFFCGCWCKFFQRPLVSTMSWSYF